MPEEWPPPTWVRYEKHWPPPSVEWRKVVKSTGEHGDPPSRYHPEISREKQKELELRCVLEGMLLKDSGCKRTYYLKVGKIIGADRGEEVEYIFAEWARSGGAVHGRPMTRAGLIAKGAAL